MIVCRSELTVGNAGSKPDSSVTAAAALRGEPGVGGLASCEEGLPKRGQRKGSECLTALSFT